MKERCKECEESAGDLESVAVELMVGILNLFEHLSIPLDEVLHTAVALRREGDGHE